MLPENQATICFQCFGHHIGPISYKASYNLMSLARYLNFLRNQGTTSQEIQGCSQPISKYPRSLRFFTVNITTQGEQVDFDSQVHTFFRSQAWQKTNNIHSQPQRSNVTFEESPSFEWQCPFQERQIKRMSTFLTFCETTSLHGWPQIPRASWPGKVFWIIIIFATMAISAYLCSRQE